MMEGIVTRKRAAWLVSDCGGQWSDAWELPVRAFTDMEAAERCARLREDRYRALMDDDDEPMWCIVSEIELVD